MYSGRFVVETERDVRSDLDGEFLLGLLGRLVLGEIVRDRFDDCGRIGGSASQTRLDRNLFIDEDLVFFSDVEVLTHHVERFVGEVRFVADNGGIVTEKIGFIGIRKRSYLYRVVKCQRNRQHVDVMIAVLSLPENVDGQIDFRQGPYHCRVHFCFGFLYSNERFLTFQEAKTRSEKRFPEIGFFSSVIN